MNKLECYGVVRTGVVPVRNTHSETSEMVNRLLLGETVQIDQIDPEYKKDLHYRFNNELSEGIVGIIRSFQNLQYTENREQ